MIEYKNGITFEENHIVYYDQIGTLTKTINKSYPSHNQWVNDIFLNGLKNDKNRAYSFAVDKNLLVGLSLMKTTEEKICCLYILEEYRKQGIASQLFQNSCEILNTNKPFITVSHENYPMLEKLLKKFNCELTSQHKGMYKENSIEYFFNEKKQK